MNPSEKYILYADDDQDDQELMHEVMQTVAGDLEIVSVRNGREVIDFLSALHTGDHYPSLIMLDINMPIAGGYQTLKQLKLNPSFAHIPVVIFSTSNLIDDKQKSLHYGAYEYIPKPVFYKEVVEVCERFASLCHNAPVSIIH